MSASVRSARLSFSSTCLHSISWPVAMAGLLVGLYLLLGPAASAQTAQLSWSQRTLITGTMSYQVAPDQHGNVWLTNLGGSIDEIEAVDGSIPASPTIRTWAFDGPKGVAVDANGNVFVGSNSDGAIYEMEAVDGVVPNSPTRRRLGGSFSLPYGVAVDASGNVYVAECGASDVKEMEAVDGAIPASSPTTITLGGGFTCPKGVAVDSSGRVYVADYGAGQVYEIPLGCASSACVDELGSGFSPYGVALDSRNNLFVANTGYSEVQEIVAVDGSIPLSDPTILTLGAGFSTPKGLGVDANDDVFVGDYSGGGGVIELSLSTTNFGGVNVGSTSASVSLTFSFDSGGMIGAPAVVTLGAAGKDFADTTTGTCDTNGTSHSYSASDTCTVIVTFTPAHPGTRWGAVLLEGNSGNVLATAYLEGAGNGPQINFLPGTQISLGGSYGFLAPSGVAVDGGGNLFVADTGNNAVEEIAFPGYATVAPLGGIFVFSVPSGVAVDSAGNLFVADTGNNAVEELTFASGYATVIPLGGGFSFSGPSGVALDGAGNVYVADTGNSAVEELTIASGYSTVTALGSGFSFSGPSGVAVDGAGNIYVADTGNNAVEELTFASGYTTVNTLGGSFSSPSDVALDGIGDIFVAASGNTVVSEIPLGCASSSCVLSLGSGFSALAGVAVDGGGNVYVADTGNNAIEEMDFADAPSLSFASTGVSATSTDSPQTVTVSNDGNATLTFSGLTIPTDFPLAAGGSNCTPSSSLISGSSCTLPIDFSPTQVSIPSSEILMLTDNNHNGTGVTQSLTLSGTAVQGTTAISITNVPASGIYGGSFAAAISYTGDGTASVNSSTLSICTVSGSTVSYVGVGTCTLTASATAGTNYTAVTGSAQSFSISQATPTITISNIPSNAIYGGAFTPAISYNGDGTASVVSNSTTICTVVSGAVHFNKVGACSLTASATETANYLSVTGSTQSFSIGQATPTITISNIPSSAAYNGSFTPSITYSGDGAKSVASNTLSVCTVSGSTVHYVGVGSCSLTPSATAGTDYAAITGSAQTFMIGPATPAISINNIPTGAVFGGSFTPSITYSGNGSPTISVSTTTGAICSVSSGVVSFIASGTCSLKASATATTDYNSVTGSAQSFSIAKVTPTISIDNIPSSAAYGGNFGVTFAYNGNGTPSVASNTTGICTAAGTYPTITVSYIGVGVCSLTPSATAGTQSSAVHGSAQTFMIIQATPTISINNIPSSAIYGGNFTPAFTYSGNGSPTFSVASSTLSTCTVSGGVVSFFHVGSCHLNASATSTTDYTSVTGSSQNFSIGQATPTISITNIPTVAVYGGSFTPTISYNGDGTASLASNSTSVCTVTSGLVSYVGVGTCSLTASAGVGTNWTAIVGSAQNFSINQSGATPPAATSFGTVNVGTASSASTVIFTFTASSLIGAPVVLTQGAAGLDFANAGTGTCDSNEYGVNGHVYSASDTCTVMVTFTPQHPGTRVGAVLLKDSLGNLLATAYLEGTGSGPQTNFLPGALSALGGSYVFSSPSGTAVDGNGNIYVADAGNNAVEKMTPGCASASCASTLGGGFSGPTGVAVDGAGNVYVADTGNSAVKAMAASCTTSACVTPLGGGFSGPSGVAVDGSGNVYVADTGNSAVEEMTPGCASSSCVSPLGGGFTTPTGVAVDGGGNVYVADTANTAVSEIPLGCTSSSCVSTLGGGFTTPTGVSVDGIGNLFVADTANTAVSEVPLGCTSSSCVGALGSGFSALAGVAVDGGGNVFVADTGNNAVKKMDLADAPSLSFAATGVGAMSTDSPQTVTVSNDGNAALTLSGLTIPADFPLSPGGSNCTSSSSLISGSSCTLPIDFTPTQLGSLLSESLVVTDNNLNGTAVTQSLSLIATAVQGTPTISISNLPGSGTYGLGFTATIAYSGDGTASLASNSTSICTVSGNAVSYVGVGLCSLTASATEGTNYIAAPGSAQTFSIGQASPTITINNIPSSALYNGSFTPTFTYTGDGTPSVASNSLSICTVSGGLVSFIHVGTCSLTASALAGTNYTSVTGSAQTFSISQATTSISIDNIPSSALYNGSFTPTFTYAGDGTPYVVSNSTGVCTVSGALVSYVGVGSCSLTADALAGTNYTASTGSPQSFSVGKATPTIAIGNLPGSGIYGQGFTADISYSGDGTASLASNSTSVCTVSGNAVSYIHVGTCSLTASATAGTDYLAAPGSAQTISIGQASTTIAIDNIPSGVVYGGSFTPAYTYIGDGTPSVSSNSTSICTVTSGVVSYVGVGTCSLTASALAGTNYSASSGSAQTFSIAQAPQVIAFVAATPVAYGVAPYTLNATSASSGVNPITYSLGSATTAPVTLSGINNSMLTINGVGTVSVKASQAGSTNYTAAASVWQTIVVTQAKQTITFPAPTSPATYGASPITLGATGGSSGNAVTYTLSPSSGVASVSGTGATATLTFTGAGTVNITANQAGSTDYSAAWPVTRTIVVNPVSETLAFTSASSITYSPSATLTLTTSSGASTSPVIFSLVSGSSYASLSSGVLTITGAGYLVVSASQAAEGNYAAAKTVYQTITINHAPQTLAFTSATTATYKSSLVLTATGGASGKPIIYSVVSGPGTIAGSTLTFTGAGTVVVAADQAGSANYLAATEAQADIVVSAATPTITWAPASSITYGTALSGILKAYANAGGSFAYTLASPSGTPVTAGTVLSAGAYTIYANFTPSNTTNYNSASSSVSLQVNAAAPALTFAAIPVQTYSVGGTVQATASSASSGAITYSVVSGSATISSTGLVTLTGFGWITLNATQAASGNYTAVTTPASVVFKVNPATPALAFTAIPAQTYSAGGTVAASVTEVSSGAIAYSVTGGPATVNRTTGVVTLTGAGTVSLLATQEASSPYTATTATTSFVVNPATPALTFAAVPAKTYGAVPFLVSATSASSGEVTYAVTSGPATVSGSTVTITGAGTVNLTATQAASGPYTAATATTSFAVNPAAPILTFAAIPVQTYSVGGTVQVTARSASSGAVTYAVASGPATVNSSTGLVTLTGTGLVTITATQAASGNYAAVTTPASIAFTVNPATPKLAFAAIAAQTYGNAPFTVSATSASTGAVTYQVSSGPATVNSSTGLVTMTGAGSVTLLATQAASGNYAAATATGTFTVAKATPAVQLTANAASVKSGAWIIFTATLTGNGITPGGNVTFYDGTTQLGIDTLNSSGVASYVTNELATGAHGIVVSYGGDVNYIAASSGAVVVMVTAQ